MDISIVDIASDLAIEYPVASTQEITDAIMGSIESADVISQAVSYLSLPSKSEIQKAEFRGKRFPKERPRINERIENVLFFKKLKIDLIVYVTDASVVSTAKFDGAHVGLPVPTVNLAIDYTKPDIQRRLGNDGTLVNPVSKYKDILTTNSISMTRDFSAQVRQEINTLSSDILKKIQKNIDDGKFLSFYDIYQIVDVISIRSGEIDDFDTILYITRKDINHRNKVFKTKCIDDLYNGEELVPEELRISRHEISNSTSTIYENLMAIILNEYQRLNEYAGGQFVNGDIDFDTYIEITNKQEAQANALFIRCL